ncbi:hypothetical protein D9619_002666 [Psilocybe cf. subviscida]|uniref:Tubulin-specific chaperone A n=1 Tax=Psilocybe cf. subviscida TaxID=2480587 RepID=A0A8H5AY72_9AGAR|nr:hypothetical protein D9619_002666 [Psilocybe cf. subviscida]
MSDIAAAKRGLKIKSGAVKRLAKEVKVYVQETSQYEAREAKLVADGADEWDIKNATKIVEESKKMIVDTRERLSKTVDDLQGFITSSKAEFDLEKDEDLLAAEATLKSPTA